MAQEEFIALIEGQADLTKAKQAFESFKKQVEQPIKITIDTNGFNAVWGNMQRQFQQQGANLGNSLTQGLNRAVKNVKIDQKPLTSLFDDSQLGGSIMSALGADTKFAEAFKKELEAINAEGAKINNIHFGNLGKSFSAEVESANTKIKVMGHLVEEFDKSGKILQGAHWEFNQSYFTDFEEGARKAQVEAEKLARSLSTIQQNVKNGDFTKQVAKMNADIKNIGKDVPTADISKVVKAATEYSRIVTNITASVNGKSANPLQGQDLVNAYAQAENALRSYNNALSELSSNAKAVGVDTGNAMRQAQAEADKLAQSFKKIKDSFSNGTFGSTFDANIKKMENDLANIGSTVSSDTIKKASDAATEYYRIMQEIQATMDGTAKNPLTQEQVVSQYEKAQVALKQYASAWQEVRIEQSATITEGQANKNADAVQAWCNRNSRALKKYGKDLDEIQKKMRTTFDANAQKELQQQAQQIYKKAGAEGLTGLSFFDQVKKAFGKIGQFTGIYAVTKQLRQLPGEMVREVIKIDTSMTELRKVSTASAYEIKNYFDEAAESASKYGQAINEVIDSTASWTRLGYDLKDASILTDVTAELAKVGSGLNVDTATEGLQATLKGFSLAADEAKRVGDMINYVADTEPIDAQGIINGLERSSAAMAAANNSLEESIGLITASTSVTQDATAAGTAWRTISMRIRGKDLCLHTGKVRMRCCA